LASKKAKSLGRIGSALAVLVLIASGCSSGNNKSADSDSQAVSDVTAQAITVDTTPPVESGLEVTQVVTLNYEPQQDGFGFQNYGGGNAPAALTVNLARRLYGDEQACVSVNDLGECTPQPVILQLIEQANRAMAGGLCEGFAVLSLRLYQEGATTSLLGQEALVAALEQGDPRVAAELAFWFVTQFSSETQAAAAFYRDQTLRRSSPLLLTTSQTPVRPLDTHWACIQLKVGTQSRPTQLKQSTAALESTSTTQIGLTRHAGLTLWTTCGHMRSLQLTPLKQHQRGLVVLAR
jgi:hypothetical protein